MAKISGGLKWLFAWAQKVVTFTRSPPAAERILQQSHPLVGQFTIVLPPCFHHSFPQFYRLPLEIRRQILLWAIVYYAKFDGVRSGFTFTDDHFGVVRPTITFILRKQDQRRGWTPFFGSKNYSAMFPVSHQWYSEIQDVLYTDFEFRLHPETIFRRSPSFNLDFLPTPAPHLIRHLDLVIAEDFNTFLDSPLVIDLLVAYTKLAAQLPHLSTINLTIIQGWIENNNASHFIPKTRSSRFIDMIFAVCQVFRYVPRFGVCTDQKFDPRFDPLPRVEDDRGIPFEILVWECQELLEHGNKREGSLAKFLSASQIENIQ